MSVFIFLVLVQSFSVCCVQSQHLSQSFTFDTESLEVPTLTKDQLASIFKSHYGFISEEQLANVKRPLDRKRGVPPATIDLSARFGAFPYLSSDTNVPIGVFGHPVTKPLENSPPFAQVLYADDQHIETRLDHLLSVRFRDGLPPFREIGLETLCPSHVRNEVEIALLNIDEYSSPALQLWLKLGHCWRSVGYSAKAMYSYRHALAIAPHDPTVLLSVASLLVNANSFQDAEYVLNVPAMTLYQKEPVTLFLRARIAGGNGNFGLSQTLCGELGRDPTLKVACTQYRPLWAASARLPSSDAEHCGWARSYSGLLASFVAGVISAFCAGRLKTGWLKRWMLDSGSSSKPPLNRKKVVR